MKTRLVATLAVAALTSGCARLSMAETGFLADYSLLEPAPERTVAFVPDEVILYRAPGPRIVDSLLIEPVEIRPAEDAKIELSDDDRERLVNAFGNYLERNLGKSYPIVEEAGEHTAVVRAAITDVDPSSVLWNIVGIIVAVPVDMGGISGEVEIHHARTGDPLVMMKACRAGTPFLAVECFQRWGHAYHGMMKWSRELVDVLDELQP